MNHDGSCSSFARMLAATAAMASGASFAADLTINLHGIRTPSGSIRIAVVSSQQSWDGKAPPLRADAAPADGPSARFEFKDLPPGSYAVMVTHDENGNGKLDTNIAGMPLEGYGFSNKALLMRKPTWEEARFELGSTGTVIDIEMR